MSGQTLLAELRAEAADPRPPAAPREPLWAAGAEIGSLEPALLAGVALPPGAGGALLRREGGGLGGQRWVLRGDATAGLALLARALRTADRVRAWRDELLAVHDARGRRIAVVERGVTRLLGIATHAVHLVGDSPDGRVWVQQRALDKANDPGRWDTLMGGMVPARDTVDEALARETWEEAGLRADALPNLRSAGSIVFSLPCAEERGGYIVERIEWFRATVPAGVEPVNQDGEVARFELLDRPALLARLHRREFTWAAQAILAVYLK